MSRDRRAGNQRGKSGCRGSLLTHLKNSDSNRQRDTTPCQPQPEILATSLEPSIDGINRKSQSLSNLLECQTFQVMQSDGISILLRQLDEFLIEGLAFE